MCLGWGFGGGGVVGLKIRVELSAFWVVKKGSDFGLKRSVNRESICR